MIKFFDEFHRRFFEMSSKKSDFSNHFNRCEQIDKKKDIRVNEINENKRFVENIASKNFQLL